jgi:hypothetical protein
MEWSRIRVYIESNDMCALNKLVTFVWPLDTTPGGSSWFGLRLMLNLKVMLLKEPGINYRGARWIRPASTPPPPTGKRRFAPRESGKLSR